MENTPFVCPICRQALTADSTSLRCPSGHSYDIARSGYVNLHRPGIKSNARSGDPEDMVASRRAFLAGGYYDRYVRECAGVVRRLLPSPPEFFIDAACGEGHHTLILADELSPGFTVGIDAAKKAADVAQKSSNRAGIPGERRFIAGNIFDMPLADSSADLMTVLFAPIPAQEAFRVLRPGGLLAVCSAGEDHLIELRRVIYDEVRKKESVVPLPEGFEAAASAGISYRVVLDKNALCNLFAMTPFCRRVGKEGKRRLDAADGGEMTVHVNVTVFKKL